MSQVSVSGVEEKGKVSDVTASGGWSVALLGFALHRVAWCCMCFTRTCIALPYFDYLASR